MWSRPAAGDTAAHGGYGKRTAGDWKRMGVRMHLMMCSLCRRYQRQMLQLRVLVKGAASSEPDSQPLPEETKERIKTALKTDGK